MNSCDIILYYNNTIHLKWSEINYNTANEDSV